MTIHVLQPAGQDASTDTTSAAPSTAYDSVWTGGASASTQQPPAQSDDALEQTMLSHDKLYVVLTVVLLVWLGIAFLIFRTDRRLSRIEERLDDTN